MSGYGQPHGVDGDSPTLAESRAVWELVLSNRALEAVPREVWRHDRLRMLDLGHNRPAALPDAIARLPGLEKLDLRWNPLDAPPAWVAELEGRGCVVRLI